ncbi:MAG: hypothetical protein GWP91_05145 [Rhodobacterales bacterium]|nr:hypothetical protein [Rhodobacterales bacterium]
MLLPPSLRDQLVDALDEFLDALGNSPEAEPICNYILELIELYSDENELDDIISELEESGALEESLGDSLESEMASNDEFEFTGEELVSLLERMCEIDWDGDEPRSEEDEEDEEDEEEEEEEEE